MRTKKTHDGLSVRTVAGTGVVILAMNMDETDCKGLRGFAIHRTDHQEDSSGWLQGMKTFEATDPKLGPGLKVSSREHPFQDFIWSDYTAKEGRKYTYRVLALKGPPTDLQPAAEVTIAIDTESPAGGDHDVYFNRGAAASQEYARRFGNRTPGSKGGDDDPVWAWLSRGAHEAMLAFIARRRRRRLGPPRLRLRIPPAERGGRSQRGRRSRRRRAGALRRQQGISRRRESTDHQRRWAEEALDGTNSPAAGHSAQQVHRVAKARQAGGGFERLDEFLRGWSVRPVQRRAHRRRQNSRRGLFAVLGAALGKPASERLAPTLTAEHVLANGRPPKGTSTVFSPRSEIDALEYYFALATSTKDALFMSFPFGMHDGFKTAYRAGERCPALRAARQTAGAGNSSTARRRKSR